MVRSNDFIRARELIVERTVPTSPERALLISIVSDLFAASNTCFDRSRFEAAVNRRDVERAIASVTQ